MADDKEIGVVKEEDPPPKPKALLGTRHLVCFLMFLGVTVAYALRVILSVTIVSMTDQKRDDGFPVFNWTSKDTILSSFFWGYTITQIPAGYLGGFFGGFPLILTAGTVSSLFTLLLPLFATIGDGWQWVIANRVLQGLSQGCLFPGLHTLLSKWSPVEERGRLATYVYAGGQMGTILGLAFSGLLAESPAGWPSVFYVFGGAGCVWAVFWFFFGANSPADHRLCSPEERAYIEHSLKQSTSQDTRFPTPWFAIFTSIPMWALIIAHCGQNWGFWTLLTEIPSYMNGVLNFDLKSNALLSSLPYLVMWILSFGFSFASDYINSRKLIPLAMSRKLFNSIGLWGPMAGLLGLAYVSGDQKTLAVALLTVAVGLNSSVYLGFQVNHIDLSPNFAGTMMGITNCAANIMSIIGPLVVGVIVDSDLENSSDPDDKVELQSQWRVVFFIAAGFYLVCNLVFVIFGKADVQPWNEPKKSKGAPTEEKKDTQEEKKDAKEEKEISKKHPEEMNEISQ